MRLVHGLWLLLQHQYWTLIETQISCCCSELWDSVAMDLQGHLPHVLQHLLGWEDVGVSLDGS